VVEVEDMSFEAEKLIIRPIQGAIEPEQCARMAVEEDPWVRFGTSYEASLRRMQDTSKEICVAESNKQVIGFVIVNMQGAFIGYIQTICVAAEQRGRGVGTKLIEWSEDRIFRDSPNVFICVSSFNQNARRLYERLGYSVIGELEDYIVRGHSELLLRKSQGTWVDFQKQ
jgi:[ribosomal protein S18]-alanine N-acetyltransferase